MSEMWFCLSMIPMRPFVNCEILKYDRLIVNLFVETSKPMLKKLRLSFFSGTQTQFNITVTLSQLICGYFHGKGLSNVFQIV